MLNRQQISRYSARACCIEGNDRYYDFFTNILSITLLSKLILFKQTYREGEGHKSCKCRFLFTTLPNIYSPHISVKCRATAVQLSGEDLNILNRGRGYSQF